MKDELEGFRKGGDGWDFFLHAMEMKILVSKVEIPPGGGLKVE
jgi:hypothetical protein